MTRLPRPSRPSRWRACAILPGLLAGCLGTAVAPGARASADNAIELRQYLERIHEAATRRNYIGTLVNTAAGTVSSSRVLHFCEGSKELERVDALDGEARGLLRVNDDVRTLWPRHQVAEIEPKDPRAAFPSLVSGSEQRIPEFYELNPAQPDRVAGRDADRVLLRARDGFRFDQLVWTDRASGLLLRVDTQLGGRTLESSMFSEVSIGVKPAPSQVYAELHRADGYRVVRVALEHTSLDAEGWSFKRALPPGFQPLGCVKRNLPVAPGAAGDAKVLQAIFSDGLTHVSLFIEPFRPQRHQGGGLTVIGATHTLTRQLNDTWLTVVGDVPLATLELFAQALERKH